ncbi:hypothetical protein ACIP2Z_39050 [Streptomyces iakyrus]|uniref:Lipoprotein n=1 Tax=Streptomyces iakyrus TaxID=68219 RepID=A0ABW8FS53_9ACTN
MGRHIWGKTVGALVLAVTVAAVSGCGSSDDSDGKPAAKASPKAPSVEKATAAFQAAVEKFDADGGCLEQEPGTCWEQMQAVMNPARDLRKAANADKETGPEFWSEAYALIDTMEDGIAVGEDKGVPAGGATMTNRDDVLGSAHDLSDWLDENPVA